MGRTGQVLVVLVLLCAVAAFPQGTSAISVYLGPRAKSVNALLVDPADPAVIWAATWHSGVWRTTDGGAAWHAVNRGLPDGWLAVRCLASDPEDASGIYAGTTGGLVRWRDRRARWEVVKDVGAAVQTIAFGQSGRGVRWVGAGSEGLWSSSDRGASWERLVLEPESRGDVRMVLRVLAGPSERFLLASDRHGLRLSDDGGRSWRTVNQLPEWFTRNLGDAAVDPHHPGTVLLLSRSGGLSRSTDRGETWRALETAGVRGPLSTVAYHPRRHGWIHLGTETSGVYRSTDDGATWTPAGEGLDDLHVTCLALSPVTPNRVYLGTLNNGVYCSRDGGLHWSEINCGMEEIAVRDLAVDPTDPGRVFARAIGSGIYRSADGGLTWGLLAGTRGRRDWTGLAVLAGNPCTLLATRTWFELARSADCGSTWSTVSELSHNQVKGIAVDPDSPRSASVLGKQGIRVSTDSGATWGRSAAGRGGGLARWARGTDGQLVSGGSIARSRSGDTAAFAAREGGLTLSTDSGATWRGSGEGLAGRKVLGVAFHPFVESTLYAATDQGLYRSGDSGTTWRPQGPDDLTQRRVEAVTVLATEPATVLAIAGAQPYLSRDDGATWKPGRSLECAPRE